MQEAVERPRNSNDLRAYSITEFAETIGTSKSWIYKLLDTGAVRGKKIGRRTVILPDEVKRYLNSLPDRPSRAA